MTRKKQFMWLFRRDMYDTYIDLLLKIKRTAVEASPNQIGLDFLTQSDSDKPIQTWCRSQILITPVDC